MASSDDQDHVSAFVPPNVKAALEASAQRHDRSVNGELRVALRQYLETETFGPSVARSPSAHEAAEVPEKP